MLKVAIGLIFFMQCIVAYGASLQKARALFDNGLYVESKKELIDVVYADNSSVGDKASALYLLGSINAQQGHEDIAQKNWRELVDRYPKQPDAEAARNKLAGLRAATNTGAGAKDHSNEAGTLPEPSSAPGEPNASASSPVRLLSPGREPRYMLEYSASKTPEHAEFDMSMTMLESDCPSAPSKNKYPSVHVRMPVTITSSDDGPGVLRTRMTGIAADLDGKRIDDGKAMDVVARTTHSGQLIEQVSGEKNEFQSFGAHFPLVPVGVGAQWEAVDNTNVQGQRLNITTTYSVLTIDAKSARMSVSGQMGGRLSDEKFDAKVEGGTTGETVWRAGHFLPPGSSAVMFMRMTGMKGTAPTGEVACILMAMESK